MQPVPFNLTCDTNKHRQWLGDCQALASRPEVPGCPYNRLNIQCSLLFIRPCEARLLVESPLWHSVQP